MNTERGMAATRKGFHHGFRGWARMKLRVTGPFEIATLANVWDVDHSGSGANLPIAFTPAGGAAGYLCA